MLQFAIPCLLGLESLVGDEVKKLGLADVRVENGRVLCRGEERDLARLNINLRCGARVLLVLASFRATDFETLFQGTRAVRWEDWIPREGEFPVTGYSINSTLHSVPACQSIVKKAIVERMKQTYRVERFEEDGDEYPIRVFIFKDQVSIGLDTSGTSLHKRGYRTLVGKAPISETLAAALLMLTPWNKDRVLVDPFCGSGTFPIEAAMIGANIAPGMMREFTADCWGKVVPKKVWYNAYDEAEDMIRRDVQMNIQGYDLDPEIVKCAKANAKAAGVGDYIHFQARDVKDLRHPKHYGFIITNPPYGERLEEKEALPALYKTIGESFANLPDWSMYLITSYEDAEKYIGRKADRNRKIYNGMIKSYFYQFMGPKPPRRS